MNKQLLIGTFMVLGGFTIVAANIGKELYKAKIDCNLQL